MSEDPWVPAIPKATYSSTSFMLAESSMVTLGAKTLQATLRLEWSISQLGMDVSLASSWTLTRAGGTFRSSGTSTWPRLRLLTVSNTASHRMSKTVRLPGSCSLTSVLPACDQKRALLCHLRTFPDQG